MARRQPGAIQRVFAERQYSRLRGLSSSVTLGFTYCSLTTLVVLGATGFAARFVEPSATQSAPRPTGLAADLGAWGGEWYAIIASEGYSYDPARQSSVAFFPLYPCLAAGLTKATGLPIRVSLLTDAGLACVEKLPLLEEIYVPAGVSDAAIERLRGERQGLRIAR